MMRRSASLGLLAALVLSGRIAPTQSFEMARRPWLQWSSLERLWASRDCVDETPAEAACRPGQAYEGSYGGFGVYVRCRVVTVTSESVRVRIDGFMEYDGVIAYAKEGRKDGSILVVFETPDDLTSKLRRLLTSFAGAYVTTSGDFVVKVRPPIPLPVNIRLKKTHLVHT